jgi:hypothetical protein
MLKRAVALLLSHAAVGAFGFALGIYLLPILTAPSGPAASELATLAGNATFRGEFRRDLADSDALHWGEGTVSVSADAVALMGRVSPGPDFKLYLATEFVQTEADFLRLRPKMLRIGDVKTFDNFVVPMPPGVDLSAYNTVIVWCESFGQFISAAKYR